MVGRRARRTRSRRRCRIVWSSRPPRRRSVEKRKGDTSPSLKPDKETKSKRQKKREAAAERAKRAGGPPKGDVKEEYRDEDGAKGPNGLPRKKGGNPSGGPCKRYNSKAGCGFNFCSFSHE